MRKMLLTASLLGLTAFVPLPAEAVDGFKATATASSRLPADTLTISFHMVERSLPDTPSRIRVEEQRLREEIRKAGARIESWTSRVSLMNAGLNTVATNFINSSSREPQAVDMRRDVTAKLTGLTDAEQVAAILGRSGIRNSVTFAWSSSQAEKVREELAFEAVAAAAEKARRLAVHVGGKPGNVIDTVIVPTPNSANRVTTFASSGMIFSDSIDRGDQAPSDQLVEDDKGLVLIVRVTATVTLQAKAE